MQKLKAQNTDYKIAKSLSPSFSRTFSRFECAIGATFWSKDLRGYFGKNGYAITELRYIGDDRYASFRIVLDRNPGSLRIGGRAITGMSGNEIPEYKFIEKVLMENVNVEEGEPCLEMFREAGLIDILAYIHFETEED